VSGFAVRAEGLGKKFAAHDRSLRAFIEHSVRPGAAAIRPRGSGGFWALRDVSFEVAPGEVLGVLGGNGAGKSVMLKILARVTAPSEGRVELHGHVGPLLEVGAGFHPELSGRDNIYFNGAILGMTQRRISEKFDEIVAFSGLEPFIGTPIKLYSSGMRMRLAFSVAAHLEPEILLIDEAFAVGDAAFREKCRRKIADFARDGCTLLLVSHDSAVIEELCDRAILLEGGRLIYEGSAAEALRFQARGSTVPSEP